MIIVFAPDIVMLGHGSFIGKQAFFILVHLIFQDELDGLIIIDAITQCPAAGTGQPLRTGFLGKTQNPDAGAISLLGMLPAVQNLEDIQPDIFMNRSGPLQELVRQWSYYL